MADYSVKYLPREFAEELRRWAVPELSSGELYSLDRIAERIYARGYDEAMDSEKRPNVNDVNRLREALIAKQKLDGATNGGESL